jgi:Ca-activated chloride channel family protein
LIDGGLRRLHEGKIEERSTRIPVERYRWPLMFGLLLLFLSATINDRPKEWRPRRIPVEGAVVGAMLAMIISARANSALDRYSQGDFGGALESFREQLKNDPNSPEINFNVGDAAYRLRKYDEAFEAFSKAMVSSDPVLQEKAYYNSGNTLFMEGNHAQDLEQQLSNYYDARYQYHQALDRNPGDEQAKKNLSLLEERIKEAEKQKQLQQQRQRSRRKQSPRKQRQRNGNQRPDKQAGPGVQEPEPEDQQMPGDQQQEPSDPNDNGDDDQAQDEPTPRPDKDGQPREITPFDQQKQQGQQPQEPRPGFMSEEEALGLLDSLKDESDRIDLMRRKTERGILHDW